MAKRTKAGERLAGRLAVLRASLSAVEVLAARDLRSARRALRVALAAEEGGRPRSGAAAR